MQETGLEKYSNMGTVSYEYDFARDGGAISDITLSSDILPDDAIVLDGVIHVKTAVTSGGSATIALKVNSSEDILAATAIASFSAGALLDVVADGTATNMILTAAKKNLTMTVATAALTAGRFVVHLRYVLSI